MKLIVNLETNQKLEQHPFKITSTCRLSYLVEIRRWGKTGVIRQKHRHWQ